MYEKYTVSALNPPIQDWQREEIDKLIEFLRKESLIKIHRQFGQDTNGVRNIAYEITLTPKGIDLSAQRRFHDYFREVDQKEYEKILSIREKKANINVPIISVVVTLLVSLYTICTGNKAQEEVIRLSATVDSLSRKTSKLTYKIDSLLISKPKASTATNTKKPSN